MRRVEETEDAQKKEELERLKKQVKGLINRYPGSAAAPRETVDERCWEFAAAQDAFFS